jgi:hypothetical protein
VQKRKLLKSRLSNANNNSNNNLKITTMETAIKETKAGKMPSGAEILKGAKSLGMVALGLVGGHAIIATTKKDTLLVNGGIALTGLGVAIMVKNPYIKLLGIGASAYGVIKVIGNVAKDVTAPSTTEGLNGILPESAKALLRKYIPTLSGMDEMQGADDMSGDDDMRGTDDAIKMLSLDDESMRGEDEPMRGTYNNEMSGLGEASTLAA